MYLDDSKRCRATRIKPSEVWQAKLSAYSQPITL